MKARPAPARLIGMKCWVFPRPDPYNPYQGLLASSLRRHGVEAVGGPRLTPLWALSVSRADEVHLHWVEFLIFSDRGWPSLQGLLMAVRALNVIVALAILRLRGLPVVWTVHNLAPHEPRHPRLERATMRIVARLATTLHVHSRWAGERVVAELGLPGPGKLLVGPHGNYIESYGAIRSRSACRRALGLPESARIYLAFGAIRPYKRIPEAIDAFRELEDSEALLIVAGRVSDAALTARIEAVARGDARVILKFGFVDEEEVADLFGAADAAILNYEEVFSSGALMAALSTGTPVVAPLGGTTSEVAAPPAIEPFEPGDLAPALSGIAAGDREVRQRAALAAAERCDWDTVARGLAAAFAQRADLRTF